MQRDVARLFAPWKKRFARSPLGKGNDAARQRRRNRLFVELLEPRLVLSTITWNTTAAPTGGDWNVNTNWVGNVVPGATDTAVIKGLTGAGTVSLNSGGSDSVESLTTDSTTVLEVITGSLSLGVASSSTLGGEVIVDQGASLAVAAGAGVTIGAGQKISDNGTLSFAAGDYVSFPTAQNLTTQIVVTGTLSATGTTFVNPGNASGSVNQINVSTGGELSVSNSTFGLNDLYFSSGSIVNAGDLSNNIFNLPIYMPAIDAPMFANNQSFEAVEILGSPLTSGQSTTFNLMGTKTTSGMYYVLPNGLSIAANASLTIGTGASVALQDQQNIYVAGQLNLNSAYLGINKLTNNGAAYGIVISNGGVVNFTNSTIARNNTSNENANITVDSGGHLTASGTTFSIDNLYLDAGSILNTGDLTTNIFNTLLWAPIIDVSLLTDNQSFSGVFLTGGLASGQSVTLTPIGTQTTTGQYYVFEYGMSVASGATLTLDTGASVTLQDQQNIYVAGQLNLNDAYLGFNKLTNNGAAYGIVISNGGVVNFTNSTIARNNTSNENANITVNSGGHLTASGTTFSIDNVYLDAGSILNTGDLTTNIFNTLLWAPIIDVSLLTDNQSFSGVFLTGGLASGQSVTLTPIGTQTTTGQYYVFEYGMSVASGATLTLDTGASVTLQDQQNIYVAGQLNLNDAYLGFNKLTNNGAAYGIVISNGGVVNFTNSTIARNNTSNENANITVDSGAHLTASGTTFSIDNVYLNAGSILNTGDLTTNIFKTLLWAPIIDVSLLTDNQSFSGVFLTGGLASGQSVTLTPIGTQTTTGQYYVFEYGMSVASGQPCRSTPAPASPSRTSRTST